MRALKWLFFGLAFVLGCGGNKVELPKETVEAPKNVQGVGSSSGKNGLPVPPDSIPPK